MLKFFQDEFKISSSDDNQKQKWQELSARIAEMLVMPAIIAEQTKISSEVIKLKLDTQEQRFKAIDSLIQQAFKIDELYIHDKENSDDWVGAMEINAMLMSVGDLIRTEGIFLDTVDEMNAISVRNSEKKELLLSVVQGKRLFFIEKILLHMIVYALDMMTIWKFKTKIGKKFYNDTQKKLNALKEKYEEICDL